MVRSLFAPPSHDYRIAFAVNSIINGGYAKERPASHACFAAVASRWTWRFLNYPGGEAGGFSPEVAGGLPALWLSNRATGSGHVRFEGPIASAYRWAGPFQILCTDAGSALR